MNYLVKLIREDDGGFSVVVPGLPGCVSQGETRDEALANIKEAIELYLETVLEISESGESATVVVDVKVA
jgi:predicted RNase H-like HicB family nuclease